MAYSNDSRNNVPIAILGMGMRLPGDVQSTEDFWELLINKKDGLCETPESRYNVESFYNPSQPRSVKTRKGYYLPDYLGKTDTSFWSNPLDDPGKFDPQQTLLMQVIWDCMENAGQVNWRGRDIGCYVGAFGGDWLELASKDMQRIDRAWPISTGDYALSNRVSYEYDLRGPSVTVETACSSSLVALHDACLSIYNGDCESAIVGGCSLIFTPTMTTAMSDNMVLSPDGICKTFDASADGFGRGEAINALYVKRLDAAIRDHDPIRAVIRGTTANSDGKTSSISSPSQASQVELIRKAYQQAGIEDIDIQETGFFECHGTGTAVGDAIETAAVAEVFGEKGVSIGSVKPNVGHGEGASGITSVIKAVLSLEHRLLPPNAHFVTPNPQIPFDQAKLTVPLEPTPWPEDRRERVSVNSFGIGGSNAHVILESVPSNAGANEQHAPLQNPKVLVVSARSQRTLDRRIDATVEYLRRNPHSLCDLAYTLGMGRDHLVHRAFVVASGDEEIETSRFQKLSPNRQSLTAFLFTGQAAQWPGMGSSLITSFPTFKATITKLDQALESLSDAPEWSIRDILATGDASMLNQPDISQPACTAIQIGLVDLLSEWEIHPARVAGHSSGEIAAAYAANAITAETAVIIAYYRGKVAARSNSSGGMLAVGLGPEEVMPFLTEGISIGCENSPQSVTLTGDKDKLQESLDRLLAENPDTLYKLLPVNVAYHSKNMTTVSAEYEALIEPHLRTDDMKIPMYSTLTGKPIAHSDTFHAKYWRENLESPVLFSTAVKEMVKDKDYADMFFVELGSHSALSGPLRQIMKDARTEFSYCPTIVRQKDQPRSLLEAFAHSYLHGVPVDFNPVNGLGNILKDIPPYPWHNEVVAWSESRLTQAWRFRQFPHHELLGSRTLESSDIEPTWRNVLHYKDSPWLLQHMIMGEVVFPAAGYIAIAVEAIRQITGSSECSVRHLHLKNALVLQQHTSDIELLTSFRSIKLTDSVDSVWYEFTVCSYTSGRWSKHCVGQAMPGSDQPHPDRTIRPFTRAVPPNLWYQQAKECGLDYGPRFRLLREVTASPVDHIATATIADDPGLHESRYAVHPTVIDQCLQLFGIAACHGIFYEIHGGFVPLFIDKIYVSPGAPTMSLEAAISRPAGCEVKGNSTLTVDNRIVLSIEGAGFFSLSDPILSEGSQAPIVSHMEWRPAVDFLQPSDLLRSSLETGPAFHGIASISLLSVIEASKRLHDCYSDEPYLVKYKNWVESEFARIKDGAYSFIPGSEEWTRLDAESRSEIYDGCLDSTTDDMHSTQIYRRAMQKAWDVYGELYGGNSTIFLEYMMDGDKLKAIYDFSVSQVEWKRLLSSIGHSNPQLRVLEVGAGTCAATLEALRCLKSSNGTRLFSRYVVTDVSPGFLQSAKSTLAEEANIEYSVLDISQAPQNQGFESESFDLIIASNVLHATPSLHETLQNVRSLLAPGGRLFLHELCSEVPYVNLIMGLFPGWWLGESEGRVREPFVSPDRWDQELREAGFTGVEAIAYDAPPPYQVTATMISRKSEECLSGQKITFVSHPNTQLYPWVQTVEKKFRQEGHTIQWSALGEQIVPEQDIISFLDWDGPFFHDMSGEYYNHFKDFISSSSNVLWVTNSLQMHCEDPRYGLLLGVARTARLEELGDFHTLEIDEFNETAANALVTIFGKTKRQKHAKDGQWKNYEFALRGGSIYIGRLHWNPMAEYLLTPAPDTSPRTLDIGSYGILETIRWVQRRVDPLKAGEVEINMKYVGLNFRDIMVALGAVGTKKDLGLEGSGLVTRVGPDVQGLRVGDRTLVSHAGVFGTTVTVPASNCMPIPDGFSFESGASMPCVYATAIYSLIMVGHLEKHQSVLIHSACGGVGLASIDVCKKIGAEIYATVGNEEKVQYLVNTVGIARHRIFHSRDSSFVAGILRETEGRGIDIVLDSFSGDLLQSSWQVVAKMGKMIEIGKRDFVEHGKLDMEMFQFNRSFHGIDLLELSHNDPDIITRIFDQLTEWSNQGYVQPTLPVTVFDATEVEKAFRYMQKGIHIGKILIKMPEDPAALPAASEEVQVSFRPDGRYLLVGGLSGIGRLVATWMVLNGARNLIFFSRTAGESESDQAFLKELEDLGCTATTVVGDVTKRQDVERVVSLGPVTGVIQMAAVLQDELLTKMSYEYWTSALAPKVTGTWNLHCALLNARLDFFLVFSSASGWRGNNGQANYAAANTFLDSFVQYRRTLGLPVSVITPGPVGGIGRVSSDTRLLQALQARGLYLLTERDILNGLKLALSEKRAEPSPGCLIPGDFGLGLASTKPGYEVDMAHLHQDARFATLLNIQSADPQERKLAGDSVLQELALSIMNDRSLLEQPECRNSITREVGKQINMYSSRGEDLSDEELANLHIDSLMSLEIRYFLRRSFNVEISLMEISNAGTTGKLSEVIIKTLKAKHGGSVENPSAD